MIPVTVNTSILIAVDPVDFRKQQDGLMAHCRQVLNANPMSGTFFVFINRAKTMIRVLAYDGSGMWVMSKRLSNGKFSGWPSTDEPLSVLSAKKLMQLIKTQPFEPVKPL